MIKSGQLMGTSVGSTLLLGLVLALLGPVTMAVADTVAASTNTAQMVEGADATNWGYSPMPISISAGQSLVWTNVGRVPHTATEDLGDWDTGLVSPGGTASLTLEKAGTFAFHCTLHPWMKGTVVVAAAAAASTDDGASNDTPTPDGEAGSTG